MKKMMAIIALAAVSTGMWADDENLIQYDNVYNTDNDLIGLKVINGSYPSGTVTIPDNISGYPVVEIGENAFYGLPNITSVKIPKTVTTIGANAFKDCTSLTTVDFGKSLTTIGKHAFHGNTSLKEISLPNTTTTIGDYAFWNCNTMTSAHLGNSLTTIGSYAFQYCKKLKTISLPNTLQSVGDHFLCACNSLTTIVIPENLTSIGDYFLHGCESMKTVYLMGNQSRSLGNYPFVSQVEEGMNQVSNCDFYVESEDIYNRYYKNTTNWKYADADNSDIINNDGFYRNGGNSYKWADHPDDIRKFEARWITVCYPTDIDAGAAFGDNALVARMTNATYRGKDSHGDHLYHIDFQIVEDRQMKANTPYLLKADEKNVGSAYVVTHTDDEASKQDEDLTVSVPIDNQNMDLSAVETRIRMLGTYNKEGRNLKPGEFLFSNNGTNMKFYKQVDGGKRRHIGAYRCYWQVVKDNTPVTNAKMGAWESTTTAINTEVRIHHADRTEVYNLRGQMVGRGENATQNLPAGIYIVNGKKTAIN